MDLGAPGSRFYSCRDRERRPPATPCRRGGRSFVAHPKHNWLLRCERRNDGRHLARQRAQEQWNRVRQAGAPTEGTAEIDSLHTLYVSELQELRSAEAQLQSLLRSVPGSYQSTSLDQVLRGYTTDIDARTSGLDAIIASMGANPRGHSDRAMRALIGETRRMTKVRPTHVRGAALVASLQRLIHFKIAGYGTAASYAAMLTRPDDAQHLHGYVEREKAVDNELNALAKAMINPEALGPEQRPQSEPSMAATPH